MAVFFFVRTVRKRSTLWRNLQYKLHHRGCCNCWPQNIIS